MDANVPSGQHTGHCDGIPSRRCLVELVPAVRYVTSMSLVWLRSTDRKRHLRRAALLLGLTVVVSCEEHSIQEIQTIASAVRPVATSVALERRTVTSVPTRGGLSLHIDKPRCSDGMNLVGGGPFWVGSKEGTETPEESPRYQTKLADFCMDATEVTVEAYASCVQTGDCEPASRDSQLCNGGTSRGEHPINCVSWFQADAFCEWRGARLPTEVEWEYAARGGAKNQKYPWGDESPDGRACWKNPTSCPVRSYPSGAFGLYDMSGNVWEWVADGFGPYPWPDPDSPHRGYRGGSFSRRFDKWMQTRLRNWWAPEKHGAHLGFRCAVWPEGTDCPFGSDVHGDCLHGITDIECSSGRHFNGIRCAPENAVGDCPLGRHAEPGFGCVRDDVPEPEPVKAISTRGVKRLRTREFDADCRTNYAGRPRAYRYSGGSHRGRNLASGRRGCKNRDVGVGWNSTCCP